MLPESRNTRTWLLRIRRDITAILKAPTGTKPKLNPQLAPSYLFFQAQALPLCCVHLCLLSLAWQFSMYSKEGFSLSPVLRHISCINLQILYYCGKFATKTVFALQRMCFSLGSLLSGVGVLVTQRSSLGSWIKL
jgi:hypothetical protein